MGSDDSHHRPEGTATVLSRSRRGEDGGPRHQLFRRQRQTSVAEDCRISAAAPETPQTADGTADAGTGGHRGVALSLGVVLPSRHPRRQPEGAGTPLLQVLPPAIWPPRTAGMH